MEPARQSQRSSPLLSSLLACKIIANTVICRVYSTAPVHWCQQRPVKEIGMSVWCEENNLPAFVVPSDFGDHAGSNTAVSKVFSIVVLSLAPSELHVVEGGYDEYEFSTHLHVVAVQLRR